MCGKWLAVPYFDNSYKTLQATDFTTFNTSASCLQERTYTGQVCRGTLTSLQTCFSGDTSPPPALNIPSAIDQRAGERDATNLVNGLISLLNPSPQCREAIMPFLCLSIFTLCDSSNHLHTILREDCLELRDDICAEEWRQAVAILGPGVLPICEDLPDSEDQCVGKVNTAGPHGTYRFVVTSWQNHTMQAAADATLGAMTPCPGVVMLIAA